jgi:hypothetical protein
MRNKQIHNFWKQNKSLKERLVMNGLYSTRLDEPVEISINSIFNDEFKPETVKVDEIRLTDPDLNLDIRGGGSHIYIADMYDGDDFAKIEKAVVGKIAKMSWKNS